MNSACLNSIINASPSGIITFNTQGMVSAINDAALHLLGLSKENHLGVSKHALEHEINQKCLRKINYNNKIDSCLLITMGESPLIIKRIIRNNPSASDATEIHYLYDITHETNVSEMKTELLFTAAHELRASLASVYGYTELLLKREQDEQSTEFLKIILNQSSRLSNMINDILDLGKSDNEKIVELTTEKFEVNSFVTEAAKDFFVHREPIITPFPQSILIDADKDKLIQALINIYSNAKKYSAENSPININIKFDTDSNMVGIQVIDKGIGMTSVQQSKLFTRFYRANPEGNIVGTGLGLCFVKDILELHAGGVEVQSKKGEGTQVTLWIPAADNSKLY